MNPVGGTSRMRGEQYNRIATQSCLLSLREWDRGNEPTVNESHQPAGQGRRLRHETNQSHIPSEHEEPKTYEELIAQGKSVAPDVDPGN
jgi:hypothetical protein